MRISQIRLRLWLLFFGELQGVNHTSEALRHFVVPRTQSFGAELSFHHTSFANPDLLGVASKGYFFTTVLHGVLNRDRHLLAASDDP
jgi:hypothetical protein